MSQRPQLTVVPPTAPITPPATMVRLDPGIIADAILGNEYLLSRLQAVLKLWCRWRQIEYKAETPLLQIGRSYTTSDFWELRKDDLLAENDEAFHEVDDLMELLEKGYLTEEEVSPRVDALSEAFLPTILDDVRMWLPSHSCYSSVMFEWQVANTVFPNDDWKIALSERCLHAFVYCEETHEIFDMLLTELASTRHRVAELFDTEEEWLQRLRTMREDSQ